MFTCLGRPNQLEFFLEYNEIMHVRVYMFSLIKEGQTYILGTFFSVFV